MLTGLDHGCPPRCPQEAPAIFSRKLSRSRSADRSRLQAVAEPAINGTQHAFSGSHEAATAERDEVFGAADSLAMIQAGSR